MNPGAFSEPFARAGVPEPSLGSRDLFPHLTSRAYLAHAAISPASIAVTSAVSDALGILAGQGVASFPILSAQRERLRAKLARLLGVAPRGIALTPGCTRGITDVALGLPLQEGETMLTYRGEFPANVTPWQLAAQRAKAHLEFMELPESTDPDCAPKLVEALKGTLEAAKNKGSLIRYVAVSAVQFQTGLRMPLSEMAAVCHENGAKILVDGIQGLGSVPLDVARLGLDAFFCGAHKWLLGLEGVGFAYLNEEIMSELTPNTAGWLSHEDGDHFLFRGPGHLRYDRPLLKSPSVFEGSTQNGLGFIALEAGVDTVSALGPAEIFLHVQAYHNEAERVFTGLGFESLRPSDPGLRSCLLSFRPPEGLNVPTFAAELRKEGVTISIPDGLVRLAPHFANPLAEVEILRSVVPGATKSSLTLG
jgi:cysteine desulfurase/selenocysteine lyase